VDGDLLRGRELNLLIGLTINAAFRHFDGLSFSWSGRFCLVLDCDALEL
jgi:hypothetical protein